MKQQATSNKQQATSNKQQATSNKQQATKFYTLKPFYTYCNFFTFQLGVINDSSI